MISNSDTLGIRRGEVRVFFKEPRRENIYQLVCSVEDFSTRLKKSDLCMPILSILSDDMRNINLGSTPFSFRFSDETLGLFLKFHLKMQIMDEINCNLCKFHCPRSGKTSDKRAMTMTMFDEVLY